MGTARTSPIEDVITALVTTLRATSAVTDLATGGIHNHVPQGTSYPYIEVSCPTDRREDTFGRYGAIALIDLKVSSQAHGDREALRITNACITALNNTTPALTSHTTLGISWDTTDRFRETINGIVTRTHVATFRVWAEQTA